MVNAFPALAPLPGAFLDDVDRHDFINTLAEPCQGTGWPVHAYCLFGQRFNWIADDLVRRRNNAPAKLTLGLRLRRKTTLSIQAIAARVHLGRRNRPAAARQHLAYE